MADRDTKQQNTDKYKYSTRNENFSDSYLDMHI